MKKVGILTFHDAHNYGAVLQAYALKTYLKKLNFDVKIINYHHYDIPDGFPRRRKIKKVNISNIIKHIYSRKDHIVRWNKFNEFIKKLVDNEQVVYRSEEELEKLDIDYWICGSDQIWNLEITKGINKGFFLDFETVGKKISYAVSMGVPKLEEKHEKDFIDTIHKINYLSVREEHLKKYIEKFTDKEITRTVDPTLLLDKEDYDKLIGNNNIDGKYLLIYALAPDDRLTQIAKKIAKNRKIKIVEINDFKKLNYFCTQISDAGPEEFLTLIKNAEVVVTNSFHGTIFSIIFEKEFYTITRLNRNSRMENILEIVGMRDRLISDIDDIYNVKIQNYEEANMRLKEEVIKSKEFLKKSLDLEEVCI